MMRRARSVDEYVAMVKDAIYETEDMRAALEYDEESMSYTRDFIDELEGSLKQMLEDMKTGNYCWRTGDLPYMKVIADVDDLLLPFRPLLLRINDTHCNGLEPEDEA